MVSTVYLIDTNVCIQLLTGRQAQVTARFLGHEPRDIVISAVVRAELEYGARHSRHVEENLTLLHRFCEPLNSVPFDDACALRYGVIREHLTRQGRPIGANDLLIAATALAHGLVLVTHNTREFERVPGLPTEDWETG